MSAGIGGPSDSASALERVITRFRAYLNRSRHETGAREELRWLREFERQEQSVSASVQPRLSGVGRILENPRAVALYFEREPTDEELQALHDRLRGGR